MSEARTLSPARASRRTDGCRPEPSNGERYQRNSATGGCSSVIRRSSIQVFKPVNPSDATSYSSKAAPLRSAPKVSASDDAKAQYVNSDCRSVVFIESYWAQSQA